MRILDFGSGNTCKNNPGIIFTMIDELAKVDPKRKFIIKWQLFEQAGKNIPLQHKYFTYARLCAEKFGYKTTASVFDLQSLKFLLLDYDIPFVKIANRPDLYWLIGEVPRKIPVVASHNPLSDNNLLDEYFSYDEIIDDVHLLTCVSEYPANSEDYDKFNGLGHTYGISDHTTNWHLYLKYKPEIYECHYKLPDSTGPDAGPFARTPQQISEIYEDL